MHDYLKDPGGAEEVLLALKNIYPEADVYTAYKFPEFWGRLASKLRDWKIYESWGRWLPGLPAMLSYYTILSPWFFTKMDLSNYDLVIVSQTGGYFPNGVKIGAKTKLVTYCHTPPRFLYGYDTATKARYKWYWKPFSHLANHILRMVDFKFAQRPHLFIANSRNVARRIEKFYRRDSEVVYPPIEVSMKKEFTKEGKGDYFLIISRIIGSKNIELAVEAANKYGFKLKVAGRAVGESGEEIVKKIRGNTVEYLGEVDTAKKVGLLSGAKAFLALERDADFGMTAVEPQAYGTPVIAYRNGGYLEAVVENKTGIFFDTLTVDAIGGTVVKFDKMKWDKKVLMANSRNFSEERFISGIKRIIEKVMRSEE